MGIALWCYLELDHPRYPGHSGESGNPNLQAARTGRRAKMEFKLRVNARNFSNDDLFDDLRSVAEILGTETLGQRDHPRKGRFSCKPFNNRFGS
jgi:hypothetical protein